jgi:hypothetical protein
LDDAGVSDEFQNVDLSRDSLNISDIDNLLFYENFDGHLLACKGVCCQFYLTESALPDCFSEEIIAYFFLFFVVFSHA